MSRLISFVIPCYGSEHTIEGVVEEIMALHKSHQEDEYEIILVNDSSPDHVWCKICALSKKYDNVTMDFLSMGMSDDYPLAVEAGSTLVRVGTAIFGAREY